MRGKFLLVIVLGLMSAAWAQEKPKINVAPAKPTSPTSGKEMYQAYCASCHGLDGTGRGPAAGALKQAPTNLTKLSKSNNGTFPMDKVQQAILGDTSLMAHGSKEMPVWGPVFSSGSFSKSYVQLRVVNLAKHIESLQEK